MAGKPLREYYEATGHAKAYDAMWTMTNAVKPLTQADIRLLINLYLLRQGYTLAIVPPVLRLEYIQLLEKAHTEDAPFVEFIADRVLETQRDILRMLA